MADNLRSLGHLDWKHLCEKVCNSELWLNLRQFFMKGHLVVWSLVTCQTCGNPDGGVSHITWHHLPSSDQL